MESNEVAMETNTKSNQPSKQADRRKVPQLPYRKLNFPFPPTALISEEQLEEIHEASLDVLEQVGVVFLSKRALNIFKAAGADVDEKAQLVRMDRNLVMESIKTAPSSFTMTARNPERNVLMGGTRINVSNATTPPFCSDLKGGRRTGTFKDYRELLKLCQHLNVVHFLYGWPVEPQDLPAETRHLDAYRAYVTLTDKVWRAYAISDATIRDGLEMARIARGIDVEQMRSEPSLLANINTNSPLTYSGSMADGLIAMAEMGQPLVISVISMAGATSPITIAGTLAQQNAEALAGVVLAQLVRPGAPVIYGSFTSNVSMRSGSFVLGTPEFAQIGMVTGQLARRYGLPLKLNNACTCNTIDAQAAYESQMSLWTCMLSHPNFLAHGVGWLENGLTCSFEKMIVDCEMLQMLSHVLEPLEINQETLALDDIKAVGPGGHYLGSNLTMQRYGTAFYEPILTNWETYEDWQKAGATDLVTRAHSIVEQMLEEYEEPVLETSRREELDAYVERRREEIMKATG